MLILTVLRKIKILWSIVFAIIFHSFNSISQLISDARNYQTKLNHFENITNFNLHFFPLHFD